MTGCGRKIGMPGRETTCGDGGLCPTCWDKKETCWHKITTAQSFQEGDRIVRHVTTCTGCGATQEKRPCRCCGALTENPDAWETRRLAVVEPELTDAPGRLG